jgi:hypothetical protein
MDTKTIVDYVQSIGLTGALVAVIYLGYTGFWVFGSQLKDEQNRTITALAERDKWQELALKGTKLAEDISTVNAVNSPTPSTSNNTLIVGKSLPIPTNASVNEIGRRLDQLKEKVFPGIE